MSDKTDQHKNLEKWFREMGYMGEMPESFTTICNSSTSFIWDQLQANTNSDDYQYPIKEISLYRKKLALENKIKLLKCNIKEKEKKVADVSKANKLQRIAIEKLDSKIQRNEEKELLLRKKCNMLEESISEAQETLSTVKRLTPVEPEENPDTIAIKETLQACSKKLEASLKKVPAPANINKNTTTLSLIKSAKKLQTPRMNLESCFALSERKCLWKSARRQHNDIENDCNILNMPKRLFPVAEDDKNDDPNNSLGIINIDNYNLTGPLIQISPSNLDAKSILPFNLPSMDNSLVLRSLLKPGGSNKPAVVLCEDPAVKKDLDKLLHNHNRTVIWNVFQGIENDIHNKIMRKLSEGFTQQDSQENYRDDLAQLHFIHIQTELQHLNNTMALKKLEFRVKQRKDELCNMLSKTEFSERRKEQLLAAFDAQLEYIGLEAKLQVLKNELHSAKQLEVDRQQLLQTGIEQVKKNIAQTMKTTYNCVEELLPYIEDMSWCDLLTKKLNHEELRIFQQFPYGYNRKCSNTNPSVYYRNLCTSAFPEDVELDTETMYMFAEILQSPFSPPEAILRNILQTKQKLDSWRTIDDAVKIPQFQQHTLESLEKQESYVQCALDKLHHLLTSPMSQQTLSATELARKSLEIWLEMPFKDLCVSKNIVHGKDYLYYKKQYDSFYNNLK
nr:unnamed protein product [Callosobruchus analis]